MKFCVFIFSFLLCVSGFAQDHVEDYGEYRVMIAAGNTYIMQSRDSKPEQKMVDFVASYYNCTYDIADDIYVFHGFDLDNSNEEATLLIQVQNVAEMKMVHFAFTDNTLSKNLNDLIATVRKFESGSLSAPSSDGTRPPEASRD